MFWGITLDSGKRYTQTVEKSFHLSMAALGFQNCSSTPVTVMVEVDKAQFAICTLQPGKIPQQPLDYCFTEGEEITFFTEGPGDVHLTGYLIEEPNALEFEDEEELSADSEESESASVSSNSGSDDDSGSTSDEMTLGDLLHGNDTLGPNDNDDDDEDSNDFDDGDWDPSKDNPKKKKKTKKGKKPKHLKEDSEESNEETEGAEGIFSNDLSDDEDEDESWSPEVKVRLKGKSEKKLGTKKRGKKRQLKADESMENDTTENETILPKKPKKKAKKSHSNMVESNNGLVNNNLSTSHQDESSSSVNNSNETLNSPKKDSSENVKVKCEVEAQQSSTEKNDQPQSHKKRKLPGGTEVEDIKKGQGKMAKAGHQVSVYYKGNLTKNKKQFDACLSGTPFSFRLGAGKVIRGWDLGVAGMQVGGKRKLIVPPSQGYGSKKTGPIPANSTLEFEIQLVKLN